MNSITATCACGRVEVTAVGKPIVSTVCYCDDCQKGAALIEALPNAVTVHGADSGTAYVLYRKDRITCSKGAELLKGYKIEKASATNRVVATCCNSAMLMTFDKGPHWVCVYRARFHGELVPVQLRICTRFAPVGVVLPDDVPSAKGYPLALIWKFLTSRAAMMLGR